MSETDVLVRLNYLDKMFATFQRAESGASRMLRLQVILSLLVIALATGLVSAEQNLELTGIKLKLPLWVFLGGGAVAAGVTAAITAMQDIYAARLGALLRSSYEDLGFMTPQENHKQGLDFSASVTDIATSLWEGPAGTTPLTTLYVLAAAAAIVLLPIAAQVAALLKLGADFGWSPQVWLPLGASLAFSVAALAWAFRQV